MRLTSEQAHSIRLLALELAGPQGQVRLFGSRLDDTARGGDVDLLLQVPHSVENLAESAASCRGAR